MQALPGQDQGQGRAPDPLPPRALPLRTRVRRRCGPEPPARALARDGRKPPHPRHDRRAAHSSLRARRESSPAAPGRAALPLARPLASGRTSPDEASSPSASGRGRATPALGLCRPRRRRCQVKSAAPSRRDRIRSLLADLKMPGALEAADSALSGLDSGALTGAEAIEALLSAQIELRNNRRLEAAMRSSRLPAVKTLDGFDFSFQPSIRREQIESLHELGFVERKENVIFLGPPGVGKTHLAISLVIAAAQSGRRVYYGTLSDLITSLEEAQTAGKLQQR